MENKVGVELMGFFGENNFTTYGNITVVMRRRCMCKPLQEGEMGGG